MKSIIKNMGIYLLVFIVAVEASGCATTQAAGVEPPGNTIVQEKIKSDSVILQYKENQAVTVPEERNTEDGGMATFADTAGTVAKVVLGSALIFIYFAALGSCAC